MSSPRCCAWRGWRTTRPTAVPWRRKLRNGGYTVFTSLNAEVQSAVQDVITNWSDYPSMRHSNDASTQASLGGGEYLTVVQPQCAAAVVNWHTGELVAIIGGRSEPVQRLQLNRAYQMNMPVGSSLKPLSVYGPAIDLGASPASPVLNLPIPIEGWTSETGYPRNFSESGDYTGIESMRYAINRSHNTSTAHALYDYVGIENSVRYLLMMGIDPDHITATGAGLVLGISSPTMIELASAFGMIANSGTYLEPYAFTQVLNPDGSVYIDVTEVQITRACVQAVHCVDARRLLKGCVTSGVGTGSRANFRGLTVAGKTGTNADNVGVTFAGMTGYYSAAVWIGSDNYSPLASNATGGTYAAPLWAALMEAVHSATGCTQNRAILTKSASAVGLTQASCCGVSGMMPTSACDHDINGYGVNTDYYLVGTEPDTPCNMHRSLTHLQPQRPAGDEQLLLHHPCAASSTSPRAIRCAWRTTWASCASTSAALLPARKSPGSATATAAADRGDAAKPRRAFRQCLSGAYSRFQACMARMRAAASGAVQAEVSKQRHAQFAVERQIGKGASEAALVPLPAATSL